MTRLDLPAGRLLDEWITNSAGQRTATRTRVGKDRNDPTHYFNIVFFDSYESAMENSNLPETEALAEQMAALADGPATYHNLEVVSLYT